MKQTLTRREFAVMGIAAIAAPLLGCALDPYRNGSPRLTARPRAPSKTTSPGLSTLEIDVAKKALLYVPPGYDATRPAPFVLMLHGAGISSQGPINLFKSHADSAGLLLLSPDSNAASWDAIAGDYGVDIQLIDRALNTAFDRCVVDPSRVAIEGFSDGATYAIGVGRSNGDLFSRVAAFSPGFLLPTEDTGKPEFFISHGLDDQVLPIDFSSRPIVQALRANYSVEYHEFRGGHFVPEQIASRAVTWLSQQRPASGG